MPPYAGALPTMTNSLPAAVKKQQQQQQQPPSVVTLNVGGQIFQTTRQTLALAGPDSYLSTLSHSTTTPAPFLDRDPDLFSILLSLLRTARLPSKASSIDLHDLASEARFYGLHHLLAAALSGSARFDAFALRRSAVLPLNGRDAASTVSLADDGSVHVAHGSKITTFDWSLRRRSTVLTCFPVVDCLLALGPSMAAAGADDFPGLRVLDLDRDRQGEGAVRTTLGWSYHPNGPQSTVQAIGASSGLLFGSFESCRRNASAVVAFDLGGGGGGGTLRPVAEIGRREVYGADLDSAIPATKLSWISGPNLLMAAGSHAGPSGLVGTVKLWDIRCSPADAPAWELRETNDCFADVTVSDSLNAIFKVGANSGDVFMADLRMLDSEDGPWVRLGESRRPPANGKGKEGSGCRIESYGRQVFCSRGGDVEMWSEVVTGYSGGWMGQEVLGTTLPAGDIKVMRRNVMGRAKDAGGSRITKMGFGGSRMVLARKDQHSVEVWESSIKA